MFQQLKLGKVDTQVGLGWVRLDQDFWNFDGSDRVRSGQQFDG